MTARFIGGPMDGRAFDPGQLNALATLLPVHSSLGLRVFALMPTLDECDRILRGDIRKEDLRGMKHPYEQIFLPSGAVEFRDASDGALAQAMKAQSQPLSAEEVSRRQAFSNRADELIEELRAVEVVGATEVSVLWQCADRQGNVAGLLRVPITPRVSATLPGDAVGARRLAEGALQDALIENINSAVRNAPTGFMSVPDLPGRDVRIQGFSLEIEQP